MNTEKLNKIDEVEKKVRKFEKKGYKLIAELEEIKAYAESPATEFTLNSFQRTMEWCNRCIDTARKFAYQDI